MPVVTSLTKATREGASAENVELVRECWAAFLRGDLEGALARVHPEVVTFRAPPLPDVRTYHGVEGLLEAYADWTANFVEFEMSTGKFMTVGDRVVVEICQRARGQASGALVMGRFWFVYTVADGKVIRQDMFKGKRQALEAATR
jgi:ketosteroid isomerase-like protein